MYRIYVSFEGSRYTYALALEKGNYIFTKKKGGDALPDTFILTLQGDRYHSEQLTPDQLILFSEAMYDLCQDIAVSF